MNMPRTSSAGIRSHMSRQIRKSSYFASSCPGALPLRSAFRQVLMKCIYPGHNYDYILTKMAKLSTLQQRRDVILCRKYFNKVKNINHKLHRLLPARRTVQHDTRNTNIYPIPHVRTERYKGFMIPWDLYNWQ